MQLSFGIEQDIDLILQERDTKKGSPPSFVPSVLGKRFSIGAPQILNLTPEYLHDDPDAAAFMSQDDLVAFDLLSLSCTFHQCDREPFEKAWVGVQLQNENNDKPAAIAWSMKPLHDDDLISESGKLKLEAGLKFSNAAEPTVGIEFGNESQRKVGFLTGFGQQESSSYWQFCATQQRQIVGSYRLALIIQRRKKVVIRGAVSAKATVRQSAAWVFTYTTSIGSQIWLPFTLGNHD
jgi:hypothetical protein